MVRTRELGELFKNSFHLTVKKKFGERRVLEVTR